ncbi:MAG: DegT/DnrJ/EryC1/StrS family aminotransferase [Candidatus Omnitrophota bacterium]
MNISFLDLRQEYIKIKKEVNKSILDLMQRGDFILGKDEKIFEEEFAQYCNTKYALGVNSGTDALFLSLLACNIGRGDEIIVPCFTYIASAFAISYTGAKPVFVDIDEQTYNIDTKKIERLITKNTKAIIPVHLFGQSAKMREIISLAKKYNLKIIEDAAQAHGAEYYGKKVGSLADTGCFSFYPTKNLGGCGDGGMVTTNNKNIYKKILRLRDYGRRDRYHHVVKGYNSRLDTIQAVILRIKLKNLDKWNQLRRKNAEIYNNFLRDLDVVLPKEENNVKHVYHAYSIRLKNRDKIVQKLCSRGISTSIYYPIPLHLQPAYKELNYKKGSFPIAEKVSRDMLNLPIYPYLEKAKIEFIAKVLKEIL